MTRVYFINRFYWPAETATAQLLTDLAESLVARGWSVSVFTGHSRVGLAPQETRNGVTIHRIGRRMAATHGVGRRAFDFAVFHLCALPALLRATHRGDIVVALTDPPLIGISAAIAAAWRGAHVVHWVQDIYPEVLPAVNAHWVNRGLSALLRWPRDIAWRRAAACVSLGKDMVAHIQASGVPAARTHIVPNWAPRGITAASAAAVQALRDRWQLSGKFVIGYSGNFGRVHDLRRILEVAEQLGGEPDFVFLFIGNGAAFAELRRSAETRQLLNVRFLPAVPREELSTSLGAADVHLISLREGCEGLVFPSKLYGIAAAGRPSLVLAAPTSEIAAIVQREGLGLTFRPDDVMGIAHGLKTMAADTGLRREFATAASRFHSAHGGVENAVRRWQDILRAIDGPTHNVPGETDRHPAHLAS